MYWPNSKVWLLGLAVCWASASFGQGKIEQILAGKTEQLRLALLQQDSAAIRQLLHPQASFGHSNGWVQSRQDCVADLFNGKLRYDTLLALDEGKWLLEKNVAIFRQNLQVAGVVKTTPFRMKLHVLQTWVNQGNHWVLLARQSAKLPD